MLVCVKIIVEIGQDIVIHSRSEDNLKMEIVSVTRIVHLQIDSIEF